MSEEENKFTVDNFLKKIQEGDNTILIVGIIALIIPLVALFFLTGGRKSSKAMTHQKLRAMTQRKNVFKFAKKENSSKSNFSSSLGSYNSNSSTSGGSTSSGDTWASNKTPEQKLADELEEASRLVEKNMQEVIVPPSLEGNARDYYLAEHNYNLSKGNNALELKKYDEAEKYLYEALKEGEGNPFLTVFALGSICALYERTGNKQKMEEAYKQYIEAVSQLPPEFGGFDLKRSVRDAYKALESVGKYASDDEISNAISNNPAFQSGKLPSDINIREVYKDFPIKYE